MSINVMSELLDTIEMDLGMDEFGLPEHMAKPVWTTPIRLKTIPTFSRYFPFAINYVLTPDKMLNSDTWLIDEKLCNSIHIIGAGDIDWNEFSTNGSGMATTGGLYTPLDVLTDNYDVEDAMMQQMYADLSSFFKNSIYPEFIHPNKIKMKGILTNNRFTIQQNIPIRLFVRHADNLMTIPDTMMEDFNALAEADVATFLYQKIKRYPTEITYGEIDPKLDELKSIADTRKEIVDVLKESHVSFANRYQPMVMAI